MTDAGDHGSSTGLLGNVVSGFARLLGGELALARAEVKQSLSDAAAAMGALVVAAVLGITAMNVLAGAAVQGFVMLGLSPIWAGVVVGAGLLVLSTVGILFGLAWLKPAQHAPKRMMASLRKDVETLKSMVVPDASSRQQS